MRAFDIVLIGTLCRRFPLFMGMLQEHLNDYDGILPHVLMGDVTRWVVRQFEADDTDPTLREVLSFFEEEFESICDADRELLIASFLENLPRNGERGYGVRGLLGPALQHQLSEIG